MGKSNEIKQRKINIFTAGTYTYPWQLCVGRGCKPGGKKSLLVRESCAKHTFRLGLLQGGGVRFLLRLEGLVILRRQWPLISRTNLD